MQFFLKVFVHYIDHAITESPKGKQEDEKHKDEQDVSAVLQDKHAFFWAETRIERRRPVFERGSVHVEPDVSDLERQTHFRADHYGIGDSTGSSRINHPL